MYTTVRTLGSGNPPLPLFLSHHFHLLDGQLVVSGVQGAVDLLVVPAARRGKDEKKKAQSQNSRVQQDILTY